MWRWLLEFGAAVIGFTSTPIGFLLLVLAALSGVFALTRFAKDIRTKVEPSHLIVFGLVGGWLLTGVAIAGAIWKLYQPAIEPSEISALKSTVEGIQDSFDAYVKPRQLTEEQKQKIIEYLLPRSHYAVDIIFYQPDDEATQYAGSLYNALHEAEWEPSMKAAQDGKLPNGGSLLQGLNCHTTVGSGFKGGIPKAMDLLEQAFRAARVTMSGSAVSGSAATAQKIDDTTELLVGRRPLTIHPARR